ncbi:MAG: MiaB/RimO family radical SAM methylthiotransferase [Candidatus Omnitrophica bacterium]|nr:MiaB/RimO family radical SAM methylthiotransferase [Candidatus Omnitrophota bacterium]
MCTINPSASLRINGERPSTTLRTALSERSESNGRRRTIKFHTLGCKVNQYDTQSIRERFLASGFREIAGSQKADFYLINTCTVTSSADQKSRMIIRRCIKENPKAKVIVTGCLIKKDQASLTKIKGIEFLVSKNFFPDGITDFSGHTRAFLKVQDGCNNFCSYCKVPLVRGSSRSKLPEEILRETKSLVNKGFKEIVLTGICLGAYGKDLKLKVDLTGIISRLEKIEGLLRIRLSSIEASDVSTKLINKMRVSQKLCRHLHIPIQSGDDYILKKMNRSYTRKQYLNLIKKIKAKVPKVAITTDVLVGFPGESEDNFKNTVSLVKGIVPLKVHIFPYSKREGTLAANFKPIIEPEIITERVRQFRNIEKECSLKYRRQFLNQNLSLLVESRCKSNPAYWEGYSDNYIKVLVKSKCNLKNKLIFSKVVNVGKNETIVNFAGNYVL